MAAITLNNPYYYQKGIGGVSAVVGHEGGGSSRVVRFDFTSPSAGANHIAFSVWYGYLMGQSSQKPLRFYIGTSDSSHANAGSSAEYTGEVTVTESAEKYTFTGSADILLLPNTKYYLWIFPGDTGDGWCYYGLVPNNCTITTTGQSTYKLTISQGTGSTITVKRNGTTLSNGATINHGDVLTITFAAKAGYKLTSHTVNGSTFTSGGTHTVVAAVAVAALAAALSYPIGTGPGTEMYCAYIGNGSTYDLYVAYIGNGTSWDPYPNS